jgi:hypothetical protein
MLDFGYKKQNTSLLILGSVVVVYPVVFFFFLIKIFINYGVGKVMIIEKII